MSVTLDSLVLMSKRNDGRDKTFRVIQYSCLLGQWLVKQYDREQRRTLQTSLLSTRLGAFLARLSRAMSTARKALKLARMLEDVQTIRAAARALAASHTIVWTALLRGLAAIFELLYYYFDHVVWLSRCNLISPAKSEHAARASFYSSVFWLLNAFCDALADTLAYKSTRCACSPGVVDDSTENKRQNSRQRAANQIIGVCGPCGPACKLRQRAPLAKIWFDVITALAECELWQLPRDGTALIEASAGLASSVLGWKSVWSAVCSARK
mmetsp:Transcript_4923/g.13247  ORF Transcript_4923/g.13247 Transcript_4923/m.13247 type:complete len:268 (+) Transcript_4923:69-872(+)